MARTTRCLALLALTSALVTPPTRTSITPRRASDDFDVDAYKSDPNNIDPTDDLPGAPNLSYDQMEAGNTIDELMAQLGGGDDALTSPYDAYGGSEGGKREGGGKTYVWQQTESSITVAAPVAEGTSTKQIQVDYPSRSSIIAKVQGDVILEGALGGDIDRDDSFWSLEENQLVLDVQKASGSREYWDGFLKDEGDATKATVTDRVFFDIAVDGVDKGRVEFGLFGDDVPLTVKNFVSLCEGFEGKSYKGSPFHRIIPGFCCQGGDVTNGDGTGGVSIYGGAFADEAFPFSHADRGLLSMANSGPDSNKSQFFVTLGDCTWLDGKHVVFGRVLKGSEVFEELEQLGDSSGAVSAEAVVAACGVCES
jgi:cyclophilin family peptidyl-prolyl cis-trans isomerase